MRFGRLPLPAPRDEGSAAEVLGGGARPSRLDNLMSRRRSLILAIVTTGCWIALLGIVRAEFKLAKQLQSKHRQSAQASSPVLADQKIEPSRTSLSDCESATGAG